MHISRIPQEIIDQYNIEHLKDDKCWCYMRTDKGMYGLKQAVIVSNNELQKLLKPYGPGMWECKGRDTMFNLVVDDFSVNITSE